jgi:predicted phage baseplate assembly protein
MPLPSPILDDRSFAQLAAELKSRIPVTNPAWTDHNESDPGITLLELFAFQAESLLYRFNQIPEATYLEFLRLLQMPLRPAQAARTLLAFTTELPQGVAVPLRTVAAAGKTEFTTLDEVQVWPVSSVAVGRLRTELQPADAEGEVAEFIARTADALPAALAEAPRLYYETRLLDPGKPGDVLDLGSAVDGMLWIAVLAEKGYDATAWQRDDGPPALLNLGFEPELPAAALDDAQACPGLNSSASAPQLLWQVSTARPLDAQGQPQWAALRMVADSTRGLTQGGTLRLELPRKAIDIGLPTADADLAGAGDFPPLLDDDRQAKLVCWLRAARRDRGGQGSRFGRVKLMAVNLARAEQARPAEPQYLGDGNGQPSQTFALARRPVLPDTASDALVVEVESASGWQRWTRVDDFFGSGRDAAHYVLDPESGLVRFGEGARGRVPQFGHRIRARGQRFGGGAAGNVAAGAVNKLPALSTAKVTNPLPATGGADSEDTEAALARIAGEFRRHDRAVTSSDFQELALATPGAQVGRADCLPRFHPRTRSTQAAGVVTVMVWPTSDPLHPDAPLPDAPLLRAVCEQLDARRLVTTELYVVAPVYRPVAVSVSLQVKEGYGIEAVRRWVELVLRQYLAPLPPYGPAGAGWPLGRRVHGPELEAAALQVEGVAFLDGLAVAAWNGSAWVEGSVDLQPWEVPALQSVNVVDALPLPPPGVELTMTPPDGVPLPFPVLRDAC